MPQKDSQLIPKKSKVLVQPIDESRQLLEKNHFIYLETKDPNFDWIGFAKSLTGKELMLQYGEPLFQVKLEPKFMNLSDARGQRVLHPHTEASDYTSPPKYLVLWCEKPADCGGGITTLSYVQGFLDTLKKEEKKKLLETQHYFGATGGVHANRTQGATHNILSFSGEKPILRFSYNYIKHGDYSPDPKNIKPFTPDPFLGEISDRLLEYYEENHRAILMEQYSLLLWDNECMMHSRTTYSDQSRHLKRIFLA